MYKVAVIGAVTSTSVTLRALSDHGFEIVGVLGHEPKNPANVSGWFDLRGLCGELQVSYQGFQQINSPEHRKWLAEKDPDIIFAVGFSQLLGDDWLKIPKMGCIGFHPTSLPKGRGRAPLAWIVLKERQGAACFFLMGKGADDGPIFIQQPFELSDEDDALSTQKLILDTTKLALDSWLPELKEGIWNPIAQDEAMASWFGKRGPTDGCIDWERSAIDIDRLIKASTHPHPGAYTFFKGEKFQIWRSKVEMGLPIRGVVGRVLLDDKDKGYLVQCGIGHIWISEYSFELPLQPKVGDKLGFEVQEEIYKLWKKLNSEK